MSWVFTFVHYGTQGIVSQTDLQFMKNKRQVIEHQLANLAFRNDLRAKHRRELRERYQGRAAAGLVKRRTP
jgi:hypothetical protein